jgi:hypothetical protein
MLWVDIAIGGDVKKVPTQVVYPLLRVGKRRQKEEKRKRKDSQVVK